MVMVGDSEGGRGEEREKREFRRRGRETSIEEAEVKGD